MNQFTHLHVHTQYSLLDGASHIPTLISRAISHGMKALAITDHGNMYGVKTFYEEAKSKGIKPIIGCETYVAERSRHQRTDVKDRSGYHLILLAKNKIGYKNLSKLISLSWIEGFYYRPRIDKEILQLYSEGLIATSACLGGEVAQTIMNGGEKLALKVIEEYKAIFGNDFYLELMDHGMKEQKEVNQVLIQLAKQSGVKLIASNDVHFINAEDAEAHDILVCLSTGKDYNDETRLKYTGQEYLKSPDEIAKIFPQHPEALENTMEIADKVEIYQLNNEILLPQFPLPDGFDNQDVYLKHLTYIGAKQKYGDITDDIQARLDYELKVVKDMGFAGYFLIVQDFIAAARSNGVAVGPGRGSAAGSAVAFCTGITNVDPIKYKLLFERFLNPERVSMPDVDIDFDDEGREKVLDWVVNKYGQNRVGHIITFGTMAAKSAIKDVARVLNLPLPEANRLTKLVPDGPKVTLKKAYLEVPELAAEKKSPNQLISKTLKFAETLEGSVRHTGVHACGIIIGPEDLINYIPLCNSKEAKLYVTQFDGKYVESVGMLKMDFLGLKTLSIIKDACYNIKLSKGKTIDPDNIPLDDLKTFQLYQNAETVGTFQFESPGMRKYLKELKPTNLEDLFAMNALYRPGPMDFIPSFIARKHGREKVEYPHPMLEEILRDTYGIMIYQEQIMQTAQHMGGFSLGSADLLRRAMGKKNKEIMEKQRSIFVEGAGKKGIDSKLATDVFLVMEKFAAYGFNRSHSAAYSIVAFQTAYLKANYPGEYMAAVLSHNLADIKKITFFMDECKRMGLQVLGPDVNESVINFTVNKKGIVRFGLGAIKGMGDAASQDIIEERERNGAYKDIYDFVARVNLRTVNRRNIECLVMSGSFDCFNISRSQYFALTANGTSLIESLLRYGGAAQGHSNSAPSLFGESRVSEITKPAVPQAEEWSVIEKLNKEKELIGIYLSAHPLDNHKYYIYNHCNARLTNLADLKQLNGAEIIVAGIVTEVEHRTTKTGNPFGSMTLEDFQDTYKFMFFSKDYIAFKPYLTVGYQLVVEGKTQNKYGQDAGELEFKISKINMLADKKKDMMKNIALKIKVDDITPELTAELLQQVEANKGNTKLRFLIWEAETKVWIEADSRTYQVDVNENFIQYLTAKQIVYKIS